MADEEEILTLPDEETEVENEAPEEEAPKETKLTAKEVRRQNELLTSELDLQKRKFEHLEQTVAKLSKAPKAAPVVEEESEFDYDLLEGVTNNDRKGFAKAIRAEIKKAGYIGRDEVDALVQQRAGEYSVQQQILIDHPELNDSKSAMYKQTQQELDGINSDSEFRGLSDAKRVQLAAQKAELALFRSGKVTPDEIDRQARIRNQGGPVGGRKTATESTELSESQKYIAEQLGVDPKKYAARAAKGIRLSRGDK